MGFGSVASARQSRSTGRSRFGEYDPWYTTEIFHEQTRPCRSLVRAVRSRNDSEQRRNRSRYADPYSLFFEEAQQSFARRADFFCRISRRSALSGPDFFMALRPGPSRFRGGNDLRCAARPARVLSFSGKKVYGTFFVKKCAPACVPSGSSGVLTLAAGTCGRFRFFAESSDHERLARPVR